MTTATNEVGTVTPTFAKALRDGLDRKQPLDSIVYRHNAYGPGTIELTFRPYGADYDSSTMVELRVPSQVFGTDARTDDNAFHAFVMDHSPSFGQVGHGLRRIVKTGDVLRLSWHRDRYTNGYATDAGLHADELRLIVERKEKTVATITVDVSVCPDNSARMIRKAGER